ncbi:MAG TPA: hypothetical protein VFX12_12565 [Vicinamibacterales bacterium]|nr:hypothetical protein [Vicinamibacterales bacterium]
MEPVERPIRVLFICRYNRHRSATAERLFCKDPALEVTSAGTSSEALVPINDRMLEWADVVFVMEPEHVRFLNEQFPANPALRRVVNLDIPDQYSFLHPELIALLQERVTPHLRRIAAEHRLTEE